MLRFALTLAAALGMPFATAVAAAPAAPPNVLFIIADDASCHFGAYGCSWAKTPHIDALAANGIVFDNAYVPTSKCAPCRAGLLTGRNPWQLEEAANHWPTFPPKYIAFTEVLAADGITCGAKGKVWGPGEAITADGNERQWGFRNATFKKFLESAPADRPFLYWFGSANPHRVYEPDASRAAGKQPTDIDRVPGYWPDNDGVRRDMLDYATEIEAYDREVGELIATLRESGRAENTLVIVTSDHGMPFPRVKGHTYDMAHRVPLVACWPAGIVHPGRRAEQLVSLIDLAPTLLELFGVDGENAGMASITGASIADILRNSPQRERPSVIMGRERNDVRCRPGTESGLGYPARAIRTGSLFYVHNFAPDRWPCGNVELGLLDTDDGPTKSIIEAAGPDDRHWQFCFGKRPADELYDLATDPDCVRNLATEMPEKTATLREELFAELRRQADPRILGQGDVFDAYSSPKAPKPARPKAATKTGSKTE